MGLRIRYLAARVGVGLATLVVVSIVVFGAIHLVPGSYAAVLLGPMSTPEQRAIITHQYGLDQPLSTQYLDWLWHLVHGDFGATLGTDTPISSLLGQWLPVTGELAVLSLSVTVLLGVPLALAAGMARGRFARGVSRFGGSLAMSTPDFVIGSVLLFVFSRYSLGFTVSGFVPITEDVGANLRAMVLPAVTLGIFGVAVVVRTGRDAVANTLRMPHVTAAVGRGEGAAHIMFHHTVRNAAIPVVTVLATYTGYLMGGAVIVENLFSLPGVGQAAFDGIKSRDYPVVQAVVLLSAAAFVTVNMLAEVSYGFLDPRVATGGRT